MIKSPQKISGELVEERTGLVSALALGQRVIVLAAWTGPLTFPDVRAEGLCVMCVSPGLGGGLKAGHI